MTSTFRSSDILQQMDFAMIGTHFASGPLQIDQDFAGISGVHFNGSGSQQQYANDGEVTLQPNGMPPSWQSIAAPGSTVADYLSHLPATLTLHHFLKYSGEAVCKDARDETKPPKKRKKQGRQVNASAAAAAASSDRCPSTTTTTTASSSSSPSQVKPKPGQIRITSCADGTTMFGCPECRAEYLDKHLLEEHLGTHATERRFVCDICGAGLKRKDHLTRHRQSHSSERPYACTVCGKAFKRKEQLTLHKVVHTGEKRHACIECGRAFYRKDHLRKHARSHAARRDKSGGQTC